MNKIISYIMGSIVFCSVFLGDVSNKNHSNVMNSIYYDNIQYTDNVTFYGVNGINLDYDAVLTTPGEFFEVSFDVVNPTDENVEIRECSYQKNDSYLEYDLFYENGEKVKVGDTLLSREKKKVVYRVYYRNRILLENYHFDSSFHIWYEQIL